MEFKNVSIRFGDLRLLTRCDFEFPMNTNSRLLFQTDAEKFFFFHSFATVKGFSEGQFLVNGEDVLNLSFHEYLKFRKNIGFGFSTRGLLHNKTLHENVILPLDYHDMIPENERKDWVQFLFEYFDAADDMNKRPSEVVPSMQKVTLLLRAVVHRPQWLLLDTPEIFLSRRLYANFLQMISLFRKDFGLRHLFFSTFDEDLSDCLAEATLKVAREKVNILSLKVNGVRAVS